MATVLNYPEFLIEGSREDAAQMLAAIKAILASGGVAMNYPKFRIRILRTATIKSVTKKGTTK